MTLMPPSAWDTATCQDECPPACSSVFDMVHVSYLIRGGTRICWTLLNTFADALPYTFQLQVGQSGNQDADDWVDVGLPIENTYYAVDGTKRVYGKTQYTHYRVKLTTGAGTYWSDPIAKGGILGKRDWRLAREIVRKERLRSRYVSQDGYLLKRMVTGVKCTICLDLQTDEVGNPDCPECFGTGLQCGYFYPIDCVWADLSPRTHRKHIDDAGVRGTINDIVVSGRMLHLPLLQERDVWVSRKTDDRYYVQSIQNASEMRGVPLIANVELRPAPFTDVIYTIEIPQQDAALEGSC
jgi:hypothetical protein